MKILLSLLPVFFLPLFSQAQTYIESGPSYLFSDDFDSILNWDFRIGHQRGEHGLELQSGIYAFDNDDLGFEQDFKITPIMINYVRHIYGPGRFNYEVGFGAGVGITSFDVTPDADGEDAVFLGQMFGRTIYDLDYRFDIVGELKALYTGEANEGDFAIDSQFMIGPTLSLRYTF